MNAPTAKIILPPTWMVVKHLQDPHRSHGFPMVDAGFPPRRNLSAMNQSRI
uniref:Uncharacterized protein n=2 Tax=Picea TaxID=3328 RepID=A0A117NJD0_PICGL|nr:hypothetical protein ABT39_MTgene1225 [Picea glauca]QHR92825.1 hypothetical protein Q903MT_gene6873 [Picea sitchensis]